MDTPRNLNSIKVMTMDVSPGITNTGADRKNANPLCLLVFSSIIYPLISMEEVYAKLKESNSFLV